MSDNRPRLKLRFRSFELVAEESEAIRAIRRPLQVLLVTVALCAVIMVFKAHPIDWLLSSIAWVANISMRGLFLS